MHMHQIETLAYAFSRAHARLGGEVRQLQEAIAELQRAYLPDIKAALQDLAQTKTVLQLAIEAHPELFERPRTTVLHDVKVGYAKQKGKVVIDDEAKTLERIRAQLPAEQAELLIRVRESVDRHAVADLTAADLKRLDIRIEASGDAVVIRPVDGEVDKVVDALLRDLESTLVGEAAA
jgi:hypothetical protein